MMRVKMLSAKNDLISKKPWIRGTAQTVKRDTLNDLYQMDDEIAPLNKEIMVLIGRLFHNVEEFYQIKEMVREIIKKDEVNNIKIKKYFKNLVTEVRAVQFMHTYSSDQESIIFNRTKEKKGTSMTLIALLAIASATSIAGIMASSARMREEKKRLIKG